MEKINLEQYQSLIKGAKVIEKDGFGIKVLETQQGDMIKLFRRKRFFSTALLTPYAVRFNDNAKQLLTLNIPSVTVKRLAYCDAIKRYLVIYKRLDGELLRDVLSNQDSSSDGIYQQFGEFIAELHSKGVYFRSAHLKNILQLPNGKFALIDVSDMSIKRAPLRSGLCERNFSHIFRYREDQLLVKAHLASFLTTYAKKSHLGASALASIERAIHSLLA
ncbi:MAG: toluene tolerance protein [Cycloclasticus sp.]|nr:toluene tolerance protein [Cycloclasticus sp.]MBQ0789947.1 toluene tolerance protein [Cycloclasticus sp.]